MNNKITEKWKPILITYGVTKNFEQYALFCENSQHIEYFTLSVRLLHKIDSDNVVIVNELNNINISTHIDIIPDEDPLSRATRFENQVINTCVDFINNGLKNNKTLLIKDLITKHQFTIDRENNKIKIDIELSVDFK